MSLEPTSRAPHSVLVVDTDAAAGREIVKALGDAYRAIACRDVAQARRLLREEQFQAVICGPHVGDAQLPLLAEAAELAPLTRRIALGRPDVRDLLQAINVCKVSRFLAQPCAPDVLLAALADVMAEYQRECGLLEEALVRRFGRGEKDRIAPRNDSSRRMRPASWPKMPALAPLDESPEALAQLLPPGLEVAVAILRSAEALGEGDAQEWAAEVERRLVVTLRDTDQAFRVTRGGFVVALAYTGRWGAERACVRVGAGLKGGLLHELLIWGADAKADDDGLAFARRVFDSARTNIR